MRERQTCRMSKPTFMSEREVLRLAKKLIGMPTVHTTKAHETFVLTQDVLRWFIENWEDDGDDDDHYYAEDDDGFAAPEGGGRGNGRSGAKVKSGIHGSLDVGRGEAATCGGSGSGGGKRMSKDAAAGKASNAKWVAAGGYGVFQKCEESACKVQRVWHGYRARKQFRELLVELVEEDIEIPDLTSPRRSPRRSPRKGQVP